MDVAWGCARAARSPFWQPTGMAVTMATVTQKQAQRGRVGWELTGRAGISPQAPGGGLPLQGTQHVSSTEAPARGPDHCIRQVALSGPGSPATPPPRLVLGLGMMKPQLLEWRRDREAAGPEAADHLGDGAFCLRTRTQHTGPSGLGMGCVPAGLQKPR